MQEEKLDKLGKIMNILVDNCDDCPLEKICTSYTCDAEWKRFFRSKVKENGVELCKN